MKRTAGILYLVIIVCGIFAEVAVRSRLIVAEDASATAANLLASPGLFRLGFLADAFMLACDVALAVLLYVLFAPAGRTLSLTAAAFRLTDAAVLGANLLNLLAALMLAQGSAAGTGPGAGARDSLVMFFLDLHAHGYDLGLIFFGVSCLALGRLVVRTDWAPSLLGHGLTAAGVVYLAGSLVHFLAPEFHSLVAPAYVIPLVAELTFAVWLVAGGARARA